MRYAPNSTQNPAYTQHSTKLMPSMPRTVQGAGEGSGGSGGPQLDSQSYTGEKTVHKEIVHRVKVVTGTENTEKHHHPVR